MGTEREYTAGVAAHDAGDFAAAAAALLPLADAGHAGAQWVVSQMYRRGQGVEASAPRSVQYCRAAADQGHPGAALDLFFLLDPRCRHSPPHMESTPRDEAESKRYLCVAVARFHDLAGAGDADAMMNLAFLYHHGFGVGPDLSEATRWFTRALASRGYRPEDGLWQMP